MPLERKMSKGAGQLDAGVEEGAAARAGAESDGAAPTAVPGETTTASNVNQGEPTKGEGGTSAESGPDDKPSVDASSGGDGTSPEGASSDGGQERSPEKKSPSSSPYLVPEGTDSNVEQNEEGTSDTPSGATLPAVDSPSQPTPDPNRDTSTKASGRRVRSRRLSFADELGGPLSHVTYHDNLHYAQTEEPSKDINAPSGPACECLCIIS